LPSSSYQIPNRGDSRLELPDIPAYAEAETEEEAIADLKEAVRGYVEAFGLDDALMRISSPTIRHLDWDLLGL
jgi:hypothetical protein